MKRRTFLLLTAVGSEEVLSGSKGGTSPGPGFIVTYSSTIVGKEVMVTSVDLVEGRFDCHIPGLTASRNNWRSGATEGIVGDQRRIPPWIVFNWQL